MRKSIFLLAAAFLPLMAQAASDRTVDAGVIEFKQTAPAPATPSAGYNKCWVKPADGKLWCLNSAGEEARVQDSKMQELILEDAGSGDTITLEAATPSAGSYSMKLPPAKGTAGQALKLNNDLDLEFGDAGGAGGAGINLVTLDTAANNWAISKGTNFDLEATIGDWLAYADAAGTDPVDMTGGSPSTTCARDTSTEINGAASLKMDLGSGSSRQGEGCSLLVNVPTAYRGKSVAFLFPFTTSGSLVQDDLKLAAYDVTNGALIPIFTKGRILGASGQAIGVLTIPTSAAQIRVGVHVARSTTGALSMVGDDFQVSPQIPAMGLNGSKTISWVPVLTGFGASPTSVSFEYSIVGDKLKINGTFVSDTPSATEARVSLPPGFTGKVSSFRKVGDVVNGDSTTTNQWHVFQENGASYFVFTRSLATNDGFVKANGSAVVASSGVEVSIDAEIPVNELSANVSSSESSTFWISSFLAAGTRVTSTPTKLGEYRAFAKNGSAYTYVDAAPSTAPSAANGIHIQGVTYSGNGGSNGNNRYEIFIGKNKQFFLHAYSGTGKTGQLDWRHYFISTSTENGISHSYDPTTGVLTVDAGATDSTVSNRYIGNVLTPGGSALTQPGSGYFDVKVSENALAVTAAKPRSRVVMDGWTGQGSTNTNMARYTTKAVDEGTAITYASSASLGDTWTINEEGEFSINLSQRNPASVDSYAIVLNNSSNATSASNLTQALGFLAGCRSVTDYACSASWKGYLPKGSVIRVFTNGNTTTTVVVNSVFSIEKSGDTF